MVSLARTLRYCCTLSILAKTSRRTVLAGGTFPGPLITGFKVLTTIGSTRRFAEHFIGQPLPPQCPGSAYGWFDAEEHVDRECL
jgi:hypothetical protein